MNTRKHLFFLGFVLFFGLMNSCSFDVKERPKYVFYFIGDGMGLAHINLTEAYLAALNDSIGLVNLDFTKFEAQGFSSTFSSNRFITGSAAAGTALASGHKTSVGTIGLSADHSLKLKSLAEAAKEHAYKVGIVSSVSIDHATPASFYAHQKKRSMYYEISRDLVFSGFDYFGGGGFKRPSGNDGKQENSYDLAKKNHYHFIGNLTSDTSRLTEYAKLISIAPVLSGGDALNYAIDQGEKELNLAYFTRQGINFLKNKGGFFMMVEGGKIDWSSHSNDAATTVHEVIDFNRAIKEALRFYASYPTETLIVVTADHETGGLSIGLNQMGYATKLHLLQHQKISKEKFMDQIEAYKKATPMKDRSFEAILSLIKENYGLCKEGPDDFHLTNMDLEQLKLAYSRSMNRLEQEKDDTYSMYGGMEPVAFTVNQLMNQKAGLGWSTGSHTGMSVPVWAKGVGSALFNENMDNTDVPKKIAALMGFEL